MSSWEEPFTGPPTMTALEDGTIWSGDTLTRSPALRPSSAAVAAGSTRSVDWSLPPRIARARTMAASSSELLATSGALTSAASWSARVLRKVRLAGSAHASVNVMVDPTSVSYTHLRAHE